MKEYDLFVIGGGSGGVRAARWSGGLGAKVGICEEYRYGGTCVIRGCVPKKMMVYASKFSHEVERMSAYGWKTEKLSFDWNTLKQNRDAEIDRLSGLYQGMLKKNNVDVYQAHGKILSPHEVQVGEEVVKAKTILIATGGKPWIPETPGAEMSLTSNEIFHLEKLPQSLAIVGGGFIAVEFACIFAGLGVEVHLFVRGETILRGFDLPCREFLQSEIQKKGVIVHAGEAVEEITKEGPQFQLKSSKSQVTVDQFMYATGRKPQLDNLGLEEVGVKTNNKGAIIVNEDFQTTVDSIYALGDVIDHINLTPVATAQGTILAENLFNKKTQKMNYDFIPSTVFTQPPFASVGLTEEEALKKVEEVDVYQSEFRALKQTVGEGNERTLIRLLVDPKTDAILGAHMVGHEAGEILQGIAIALKANVKKKDFDRTIGIHPTSAEEFVTLRQPKYRAKR